MHDTLERVCFLLTLRPERVEDYLAAHATVWPEMLDALRGAGWSNYSLFLRPADGLVVGYLETGNFDRAVAAMDATEVNARWQASMAEYFQAPPGVGPDEAMQRLSAYFHLG
jgi:L-rhamnose mutarotase